MQRTTILCFLILTLCSILMLSCSGRENRQSESVDSSSQRKLDYVGEVSFLDDENAVISTVDVAVADDNRERSEGLMNITDLPSDSGMLFIFENEQPRSFWMANTPLSLDIIFVNSNMEIVRVHRNTQPYSQKSIESEAPAKYVIEVNAGYALDHDIREGMKVRFEGV